MCVCAGGVGVCLLWYMCVLSGLVTYRSGKSSISKVVFHKLSPNETLFLESTSKVVKDDISNSSFVQFQVKYTCRVSFRGGRGGAFAPPRLTLAPPWNWQICMVSVMLREPCPPTKLHIAVLPPLGPNPERNTESCIINSNNYSYYYITYIYNTHVYK